VLLAALLLSACGTSTTTPAASTTTKPTTPSASPTPTTVTPKSGGTLRIGVSLDATALGQPHMGKVDTDSILDEPAIERLYKVNEKGDLSPWLAESLTADASSLSLTIKIKKGINFSDGTAFNADALVWNYQLNIDNKLSPTQQVKTVEKIDDYTVKVTLKEWDADATYNVAGLYPVSPTAWQKNGIDWGKANPVGTGPFMLASRERDANIKYVKNPNYWQKGKPYLNGIDFIIVKDDTTRLASFKAGEMDMTLDPSISQAQEVKNDTKYVTQIDHGVGSFRLGPDGNNPDSPFYKKEVRQAIGYAIDKQALVDGVLGGYGIVATQWFPPGTWLYNPDLKGYPLDLAKAKQLLAAGGYPDGFKTQLIGSNAGIFPIALQAIQGMLAKVGITADLNLLAPAALDALQKGGWKNGITIRQLPPSPFMLSWCSAYVIYSTRTTSVSLLNAADIDDAAHKANLAPDLATRQPLAWKLMDLLYYQDAQISPLFISDAILLKYPYVKDEGLYSVILTGEWHPENGWLNK
jgi:peptide/nickel transport system substrate-binding protein